MTASRPEDSEVVFDLVERLTARGYRVTVTIEMLGGNSMVLVGEPDRLTAPADHVFTEAEATAVRQMNATPEQALCQSCDHPLIRHRPAREGGYLSCDAGCVLCRRVSEVQR
jgi:hypothetical protein